MIPDYLSPLANHLWQSTIVVGTAALLALALRSNSARVRYWVWFAVHGDSGTIGIEIGID